MPSDLECCVYVVLPGSTAFVTAGRLSQSRERPDAVEPDPVSRVSAQPAADLRELFGRICFNWEASLREALMSPGAQN
jgi:hypothetical protein